MSAQLFSPFDRVLPGKPIPEFSLRSTTNQRIRSADLIGHRLVIVFTGKPGDRRSRVLLSRVRSAIPAIEQEGGLILAVAPVAADTGFIAEPGTSVPFPLLRDVASLAHRQFGAVDWSGEPASALFVTDPCQRVIFRALTGLDEPLPTAADILTFLRMDQLTCPTCGALIVPRREAW